MTAPNGAGPVVLAGDVGGTKVVLGLFRGDRLLASERYPSRGESGLEPVCSAFLAGRRESPRASAFGVAGPVVKGRVETTNLPWVVETRSLERMLGGPVALLNDLEATGHGVDALDPASLLELNEGREVQRAPRALIAAGTGLGQGYMVFDAHAGRYAPAASEGGHSDFGARTDDEIELLRHLRGRYGHVSAERVVSGMGIREIFDFLAATGRHPVPAALREAIEQGDPPAVISRAAMDGTHAVCVETMRLFASAYGAEAGNLALKIMALGGVYVGGGIAPKVLPLLTGGRFLEGFFDKGRFAPLMARMPVRVILDPDCALRGAARAASRLVPPG
ncbi:MAG TPA: glucokinase [Candidatus Polarisedimenticolia bacterium]|nr:glucokinase [Candidatus Polarisedimenticolia bacterium]